MAIGPYEAADRYDSTIAMWSPRTQSIDADILPEKETIDARTRDIARNDSFVQGGTNLHKDNIVGAHYLLNCRPSSKVLFGTLDDMWEEEFQEEVEEKWELYADNPNCWIDAARQNTFTAHIRMGVGIHLMAGEMLAAVEWVRDDGAPFSTAIQMVELDRLSTREDDGTSLMDPFVRAGVRFNRRGAPIGYQIRNVQKWDYGPQRQDWLTWKEIPARKPWGRQQIIHLFENIRPEQTRGVTELAAAIKASKIGHTFRDVQLQNAAAQALYAAAITSERPTDAIFAAMGNSDPASMQRALEDYSVAHLTTVSKFLRNGQGLAIDGVRIPRLLPGEKLELLSPGKAGPLGGEFEQSILRYMAASLGVSYEQLSRDYTNTNYSSARAAMSETWKYMQSRKKLVADRFGTIMYRLWLEEAINKNQISSFPKSKANSLYEGGRLGIAFDALSRCEWIGAARGQIDEGKETDAAIARLTAGLSTLEDEIARLGKDYRKVLRQVAREQKMIRDLGLVLPGLMPKASQSQQAVVPDSTSTDAANQDNANANRSAA
jgi:lambda family phage portal protein